MADGLNVVVSADVARLTAAMLQAQSAIRVVGAEARKQAAELNELTAAGQKDTEAFRALEIELRKTAAELQGAKGQFSALKAAMSETDVASEKTSHGIGGITRELLVLGHEASQGNFKRLGGSLMVMGELLSNTIPVSTLAFAGAIGVAGFATFELLKNWIEVEQAVKHASGMQLTTGTLAPGSQTETRAMMEELRLGWHQSGTEAAKLTEIIRGIGGPASTYARELARIAAGYSELTGLEPEKSFEEVAKAANQGAEGLEKWANAHHLLDALDASQKSLITNLVKAGDEQKAIAAIIGAVNSQWGDQAKKIAAAKAEYSSWTSILSRIGSAEGGPVAEEQVRRDMQLLNQQQVQPGRTVNQDLLEEINLVGRVNEEQSKRAQLYIEIANAQKAETDGVQGAHDAQMKLWRELAQVHTDAEKEAHEKIVAELQQQLILTKENATQRAAIEQKLAAEMARYFGQESSEARNAANQVIEAERAAADKRLQIELTVLRGKLALAKDNLKEQLAIQNQINDLIVTHAQGNAVAAGGGTAKTMVETMKSLGYGQGAIAGVMGNAMVESSLNPTATNGTHNGLLQWDASRFAQLQAYAESIGKSWQDAAVQVQFMDRELSKLDPGFKTASGSAADLAARFEKVFERSGGQLLDKRQQYAAGFAGSDDLKTVEAANKTAELQKEIADKTTRDQLDALQKQITAETTAVAQRRTLLAQYHQVYTSQLNAESTAFRSAKDFEVQETARIAGQEAQLALKNLEDQRRRLDQAEAAQLRSVERRRQGGEITVAEAAAQELRIGQDHQQAVQQIVAQEAAAASKIEKLAQDVNDRKEQIDQKYNEDRKAVVDKLVEQEQQKFRSLNTEVSGALANGVMGVITGRESAGAALGQFVENQATKLLDSGFQKIFSGQLEKSFVDFTTKGVTDTAGMTAGATAATPILSTSIVAGATAAAPILSAAIAGAGAATGGGTAIAAGAGAAASGGGLFSSIGSFFGNIGSLFAFEHGGIIPSAAGGWVVPSGAGGVPSILHPREMVLPAHLSDGIQNAIGGGGLGGGGGDVHVHFNGPADGPSIDRWFRGQMARNSGAVRDTLRSNALTPRMA